MTPNQGIISSVERQEEIYSLILRESRITVAQVCRTFGVSEATARRDLDILAEQGKLKRVHGGAIRLKQAPPENRSLNEALCNLKRKNE